MYKDQELGSSIKMDRISSEILIGRKVEALSRHHSVSDRNKGNFDFILSICTTLVEIAPSDFLI
jgi:hypothetical protein